MNEIEQAENNRLKVENSYLLSRLIETETILNQNLERLTVVLERLCKVALPAQLPRLLTPEQAADILAVTPEAVYKWISEGKIPVRRAGSKPRFELSELMNWTIPTGNGKRAGTGNNMADVVPLRRS